MEVPLLLFFDWYSVEPFPKLVLYLLPCLFNYFSFVWDDCAPPYPQLLFSLRNNSSLLPCSPFWIVSAIFWVTWTVRPCNDQRWAAQQADCMVWQELTCCDFVRHYKCDKCQTLHDGTAYWALAVHTIFSDLDHISRRQCQTVLTEDVMFLSHQFETVWVC